MLKKYLTHNLTTVAFISVCGCSHGGPVPKWDGKLYAGDSKRSGVTRAQSNEFISASDPVFDSYLAMTYHDFENLYTSYVLGCKQWRKGVQMMSAQEAYARFSIAMKDMEMAEKIEEQEKAKK